MFDNETKAAHSSGRLYDQISDYERSGNFLRKYLLIKQTNAVLILSVRIIAMICISGRLLSVDEQSSRS